MNNENKGRAALLKKGILFFIGIISLVTIYTSFSSVSKVSADTLEVTKTQGNAFDKYVTVNNNQYIFNNSHSKISSPQQISDINKAITTANDYVNTYHLTIDPKTKIATQVVLLGKTNNLLRSYGRTGVLVIRWNSLTIGLDKGLVNDILHAGLAGGGAYLGFLAGGPGASAAGAIVGTIIDRHLDTKSGWWFDYNFILRSVTGFGRQ